MPSRFKWNVFALFNKHIETKVSTFIEPVHIFIKPAKTKIPTQHSNIDLLRLVWLLWFTSIDVLICVHLHLYAYLIKSYLILYIKILTMIFLFKFCFRKKKKKDIILNYTEGTVKQWGNCRAGSRTPERNHSMLQVQEKYWQSKEVWCIWTLNVQCECT